MGPTVPDDFERMWADLAPVGRSAASGGYFRQPFTSAERELDAWFVEQAEARGLRVERDEIGNVVAWWDAGAGPGVLTGSHLDSVLDGGAYDGPLGVVSALAAVDALRERGVDAGPADRRRDVRGGGGVAVRHRLPGLPARDRCHELGARRASCATATGWRSATWRPAGRRRCWPTWRRTSSCTWSRAATWWTAAPRSGWAARSGRTAATGSTSPARPTTPAPPGWRTASTRC